MFWKGFVAAALILSAARALDAQERGARLVNRPATGELEIIVGPVDLPRPAGHAHEHGAHGADGAVFPPIDTVVVPFDVYVHGARFEVVDGDGSKLPAQVLHHLNLLNPDTRELFAPISQRLLAMGMETGAKSVPPSLLGVPLPAGTRIIVAVMLHNPTGKAHDGVELRIYLKYSKMTDVSPRSVGSPFQLDVAFPTGDKDVDLPPGRSEFSYEGSPAIPGRVMIALAHLHQYAVSIRFEDVTDSELIWEGLPIYDDRGQLTDVTVGRLYESAGAVLRPDHTYRVTVTYDNPTPDTLYSGGMGVIGGIFVPDDPKSWPDADKSNPIYVLDRKHYLREIRGRYAEIVDLVPGAARLYPPRRELTAESRAHQH